MDLFVYASNSSGFDLSSAKFINNYSRATWVERFNKASDFVIEAPLDSDLFNDMPIGSLVSHVESDQVCVVENIELVIDQDSDTEDSIIISGRGFETFLENRITGSNKVWPAIAFPQSPYEIPGQWACVQARKLIADHIDAQVLIDDNDALPAVNVYLDPYVWSGYNTLYVAPEIIFDRTEVYQEVLNILSVDNLGLQTLRPRGLTLDDGRDSPSRYEPNGLTISIFPAFDRTKSVTFSHAMGDIKKANYLFSNKSLKTSCLVYSRYFAVMVHGPYSGYNRRVMVLQATDLDEQYNEIPGFAINSRIMAVMEARGRAALAAQTAVSLSNVELDDKNLSYVYRKDYKLGDYVSVLGDYQASTTLQVTEHVEIQDETGYVAYPTLSEPPLGGYYVPSQYLP